MANSSDMRTNDSGYSPQPEYTGKRPVLRNQNTYAPSTPTYHWTDEALCGASASGPHAGDYEWWWSITDKTHNPTALVLVQAREICAACPVRDKCLIDSYEQNDTHLFRAGMLPDERRAFKRNGTLPKRPELEPCAKGHDASEAVYYRRVNQRGYEYWSRRCKVCNIEAARIGRAAQGKAS